MKTRYRLLFLGTAVATVLGAGVTAVPTHAASASDPLWVTHVRNYPGGITAGVRAYASAEVARAQASHANVPLSQSAFSSSGGALQNVKMDQNTNPPLPQNETNVAVSLDNPDVAVAGSNDYVS